MNGIAENTTTEVTVEGWGRDEDEAYDNALHIADSIYQIATSIRIRKVPNKSAWRVVFAVYKRHDGRPIK